MTRAADLQAALKATEGLEFSLAPGAGPEADLFAPLVIIRAIHDLLPVVRAAQAVMDEADELNDGWIDEADVTWLALGAALAAFEEGGKP